MKSKDELKINGKLGSSGIPSIEIPATIYECSQLLSSCVVLGITVDRSAPASQPHSQFSEYWLPCSKPLAEPTGNGFRKILPEEGIRIRVPWRQQEAS
jgi:hypothetical protein